MRTPRVPHVKKSTAKAAGNASLIQRVKVSHCGPLIVPFMSRNEIWAKAAGYNFTCNKPYQHIEANGESCSERESYHACNCCKKLP
jgi:hypothetical protein